VASWSAASPAGATNIGRSRAGWPATQRRERSASPADFGLRQVYVADLDAIAGAEPAWQIYEGLASCGLTLWIDAGVHDSRQRRQFARLCHSHAGGYRIVVGLESLAVFRKRSPRRSKSSPARCSSSASISKPASRWQPRDGGNLGAEEIALAAIAAGARRLIVLDLARVGSSQGRRGARPLPPLCSNYGPSWQVVTGGGVRGLADLEELAAIGCWGALVASALHDGRLTAADCRRLSRGAL